MKKKPKKKRKTTIKRNRPVSFIDFRNTFISIYTDTLKNEPASNVKAGKMEGLALCKTCDTSRDLYMEYEARFPELIHLQVEHGDSPAFTRFFYASVMLQYLGNLCRAVEGYDSHPQILTLSRSIRKKVRRKELSSVLK